MASARRGTPNSPPPSSRSPVGPTDACSGSTRLPNDLAHIARRDAAAAALAQGLGTLVAGATLIGVLLVSTQLEPVWLGALALLTLGVFEATAPLPEAATRAGCRSRGRAPADGGVWPQTCARVRLNGHTPTSVPEPSDIARRAGPLVLDGVDLELHPGERIALIGASGAGKTVLAHLLAGLNPPDEGEITTGQTRLAGQDAHLFATSIANNVRIGKPDAADREVDEALRERQGLARMARRAATRRRDAGRRGGLRGVRRPAPADRPSPAA